MMELLFSNYPPVKTESKTFIDAFYKLISISSKLDIAVGYISPESLAELQKIAELNNNIRSLNLIIGMHYFNGFTKRQYEAAISLNNFLMEHNLGVVYLVVTFKYHGKIYYYDGVSDVSRACIIGSNNLSSIVDSKVQPYESSILIDDSIFTERINSFIDMLKVKASKNIRDCTINMISDTNSLLEGYENVKRCNGTYPVTDISFEIPIKTEAKSNLNVFFGKGRKNAKGAVKPRHWYEVELIVPQSIRRNKEYPKKNTENAVFKVITDDGWMFSCNVSGDDSKNFRSNEDLTILGKWIKGRMEYAGVLKVGEPVTVETLNAYGRDSLTFTKTREPGIWFLDFKSKK